jgi:transposase
MNPIEKTFAMLKAWIKKNNTLIGEFDSFGSFLRHALRELHLDKVAVNFIRYAGYTSEPI